MNKNINIEVTKASMYSRDSRFVFSKIKELLGATKVIIDFEYVKIRELSNDNIN